MQQEKQVIIHTGFHKTASSSIQHTLGARRELLEKNGYIYPDMVIDNKRFYNQSIPLFGLYTSQPERFKHYWYHNQIEHSRANQLIRQQLNEELSRHTRLVFSDEFVSTLNESELIQLKSDFEEKGFRVKVISFVREPHRLIVSVAQQEAKSGHIQDTMISNRAEKEAQKVRKILSIFGSSAEFYSFETACRHERGPVGFFLDLLGVFLAEQQMLKVNEGLSLQAARLVSFINSKDPLFSTGSSINPIRKSFDIVPLLSISGDRFALNEEESAIVKKPAEQARKIITELLGKDFFPDSGPVTVAKIEVWNSSQIEQIMDIVTELDLYVLLRIHDYFAELEKNTGIPYLQKIAALDELIRRRLNEEFSPSVMVKEKRMRPLFNKIVKLDGMKSALSRLRR